MEEEKKKPEPNTDPPKNPDPPEPPEEALTRISVGDYYDLLMEQQEQM